MDTQTLHADIGMSLGEAEVFFYPPMAAGAKCGLSVNLSRVGSRAPCSLLYPISCHSSFYAIDLVTVYRNHCGN